jgi:CHAP domain
MPRHLPPALRRLLALLCATALTVSTLIGLAAVPAEAANNPAATVACGTPASSVDTLRAAIVACANAQLGGGTSRVAESPEGSNCNPYAKALGRGATSSGISGSACPSGTSYDEWCADTSDWVWANALPGSTLAAKEAQIPGWSTLGALASSFESWAVAEGTWQAKGTYTPQPGDAVVFGGTGHVGIVISVASATSITIVSGNSGTAVNLPSPYGSQNVEVSKETGNPATWNVGSTKTPELVLGYAEPKTTLPAHDPIGNLESATPVTNAIDVKGWALDPDAGTAPIQVAVYVDANEAVITANVSRPDVAAVYPAYGPNHGFTAELGASPGSHKVCAYGLNVGAGSTNPLLHACITVTVAGAANQPPIGSLDSVTERNDSIEATGWTADPDFPTAVTSVQVFVDGVLKTADNAGDYRADVAAAHPSFGGNHGYTIDIPEGTAGMHTVCVYGQDASGGPSTEFVCKSVAITSGLPFGSLDSVTGTAASLKIVGWSIDPDAGQAAITVDVYIDGVFNQHTVASVARSDVGAVYPVDGPNHGYSTFASVSAGTHTVCTYGINTGPAGSNPKLACKTVTVP